MNYVSISGAVSTLELKTVYVAINPHIHLTNQQTDSDKYNNRMIAI